MRLGDQVEELLDLVREVFPPPDEPTSEAEKDREETENEEQNEDMNDTSAGEHIDGDRKESVDGEPMETSWGQVFWILLKNPVKFLTFFFSFGKGSESNLECIYG